MVTKLENISSFADCGDNFVSIRIPAEMLVEILKVMPESEGKKVLLQKVGFSARRCKSLAEELKKSGLT